MPDLASFSQFLSSGPCAGVGPHVVNKAMLVSSSTLGEKACGAVEVQLLGHVEGDKSISFWAKWYVQWEYDGINLPTIAAIEPVYGPGYNPLLAAQPFPSAPLEPVIVDFDGCPHIAIQFGGALGVDVDVDTYYQFLQVGGV